VFRMRTLHIPWRCRSWPRANHIWRWRFCRIHSCAMNAHCLAHATLNLMRGIRRRELSTLVTSNELAFVGCEDDVNEPIEYGKHKH
jgi:hypothetical protein